MNLSDYLKTTLMTQEEFAQKLGVTQGAISQWLLGREPISPARAATIEKATRGKVTRLELRPDVFGPLNGRKRST
jgi:DNA-binding transcriptional regulator YdaS (Cro superfamily)